MIKSRVYLAGALLVAAAGAANAGISVTPTVVSDYDFRGFTQTGNSPAFQLGVTYAHDSGFYAGLWGSNINFGPGDPNVEVDLSSGFTFGDAKDGLAWDLGAVYYTYISGSQFNYPELYAGVTHGWFNAKLFYSWNFGNIHEAAYYISTTGTFPLPANFGLVVHAGYSGGSYWDKAVQGNGDTGGYFDWSVGATYTIGKFALGLTYIDGSDWSRIPTASNPDHIFDSQSKVVGSISTTLPWASE